MIEITTGIHGSAAPLFIPVTIPADLPIQVGDQQRDGHDGWSFGCAIKQAWNVTQVESFVGQSRTGPSFLWIFQGRSFPF